MCRDGKQRAANLDADTVAIINRLIGLIFVLQYIGFERQPQADYYCNNENAKTNKKQTPDWAFAFWKYARHFGHEHSFTLDTGD